jgi:hypothetical protein
MPAVTKPKQHISPMSLHVVTTDGSPFDHALDGESFVVGRSSKADLTVPDRSMSRMHARFYLDNGAWHVEDLGSRNGTLLGGRPVNDPAKIGHGSVMQVGSTSITLREATRPAPDGTRTPSSSDSHTIFRSAAELLQAPEEIRTDSVTPMGEGLRRYADRLQLLTQVNLALDRVMSLGDLLDLILDRAFEHLGPEDAAIYLRNEKGGYDCAASRSVGHGDPEILFSTNLMEQVVEGGQAALVLDAQTDERFNEAMSLLDAGVRSLVAAPLLDPDGALGLIVLGSRLTVRQFEEEDMELLASLASVAAMRIRNVHLAEEAAERRRLEQEVALAREIQVSLLPDTLPEVEGWDIVAGNIPSRGVSGDFFKVELRHDESEIVLMLSPDCLARGAVGWSDPRWCGARGDLHFGLSPALRSDASRKVRDLFHCRGRSRNRDFLLLQCRPQPGLAVAGQRRYRVAGIHWHTARNSPGRGVHRRRANARGQRHARALHRRHHRAGKS